MGPIERWFHEHAYICDDMTLAYARGQDVEQEALENALARREERIRVLEAALEAVARAGDHAFLPGPVLLSISEINAIKAALAPAEAVGL